MSTYSDTLTTSQTDAYTEARARYVMGKAYDDLLAAMSRGFSGVTKDRLNDWRDVLLYLMEKRALKWFQLQIILPDGTEKAVMYELQINGSFLSDDRSGGINFFQFPQEATVKIVLKRNQNNYAETSAYLAARGWTSGAKEITGSASASITYSKDNYGLTRKMIG